MAETAEHLLGPPTSMIQFHIGDNDAAEVGTLGELVKLFTLGAAHLLQTPESLQSASHQTWLDSIHPFNLTFNISARKSSGCFCASARTRHCALLSDNGPPWSWQECPSSSVCVAKPITSADLLVDGKWCLPMSFPYLHHVSRGHCAL